MQQRIFKSLSMLNPAQKGKTKPILRKLEEAKEVSITEDGLIRVGNRTTSCNIFPLQHATKQKKLPDPDYKHLMEKK